MSVHQIIYTSCRRGISGVGDGMQIYSHDASFQDVDGEELWRLFYYQPPDPGRPMTDELVRSMPHAYKYQCLPSGALALVLNTYLGRDYMGEGGRFGNHLSHVIICDPEDMASYPAEYYGGELLRGCMTFEEVNSPEPPPCLPEPILERSFSVTLAAAAAFLSGEGRMEVYKQMLCAMLSFTQTQKRVVILDEPENVILWIAALGYALPRRNAMEIDFSTYEYAPALSPSRVCGAVRTGTRFDGGGHFVFDLLEGPIPALEPDPAFSGFIADAFSFPFERLRNFHKFLDGGYDYNKADKDVYGAYALYTMLADGSESIPAERLALALDFAGRFAREEEALRIVRFLLPEDGSGDEPGITAMLLEAFAGDAARLTGMALTLEGALLDRPEGALEAEAMWDCFGDLLLSLCPAGAEAAYAVLGGYRRYDRTYPLYVLALSRATGPEECAAAYETHDRALVQKNPAYAAQYGGTALEAYQVARSSFLETPASAKGSIFQNVKSLFKRRRN